MIIIIIRLLCAYALLRVLFQSWDWVRDMPDEWYDEHPKERTWKDNVGDALVICIPFVFILNWLLTLCN